MQPSPGSADGRGERFDATRWSVVLAAGGEEEAPTTAQAALTELCQIYWTPLYGFVRSRGYSMHDAQDLTQGFFAHLIERRIYLQADQRKGKFRSFLLASLKNFLTDAYDRERALKRGGACQFLPLHEEQAGAAEALFQSSAVPGARPPEDKLFERQWAQALIAAALEGLRAEFTAQGKSSLFASLEIFLRGSAEPLPSYDQLAGQLSMPASTVRTHVTRMRARYREFLRAELRRTVNTAAEVDEELRELLRVLTAT